MNVPEYIGKDLLRDAGLRVPPGSVVRNDADLAVLGERLLVPCVIKAQIAAGKRGKSGGVLFASDAKEARAAAQTLLGSTINEHLVECVLIEAAVPIAHEYYAAVMNDTSTGLPLVLFSSDGGMEIEDVPHDRIARTTVDIRAGFSRDAARALASAGGVPSSALGTFADVLVALYSVYDANDAELLEINPLVRSENGDLYALDCKLVLDDSARRRHEELFEMAATSLGPQGTELERRARRLGLLYMELDGNVGILANGAGLTMTTMDVVAHYGGRAANFMEIGGEAYTKATPALEIVLANPRVRSLLVNFCGAFAQTDVMARGAVDAIKALGPLIPVAFSIHGTGEEAAIAIVRDELGIEPYDSMDDAVRFAIAAAASSPPIAGAAS